MRRNHSDTPDTMLFGDAADNSYEAGGLVCAVSATSAMSAGDVGDDDHHEHHLDEGEAHRVPGRPRGSRSLGSRVLVGRGHAEVRLSKLRAGPSDRRNHRDPCCVGDGAIAESGEPGVAFRQHRLFRAAEGNGRLADEFRRQGPGPQGDGDLCRRGGRRRPGARQVVVGRFPGVAGRAISGWAVRRMAPDGNDETA